MVYPFGIRATNLIYFSNSIWLCSISSLKFLKANEGSTGYDGSHTFVRTVLPLIRTAIPIIFSKAFEWRTFNRRERTCLWQLSSNNWNVRTANPLQINPGNTKICDFPPLPLNASLTNNICCFLGRNIVKPLKLLHSYAETPVKYKWMAQLHFRELSGFPTAGVN